MISNYKTVSEQSTFEIVEKKSKFICNIYPCVNEEECKEQIEKTRKQYYDARHNCFAYIVGIEKSIERYSDDGEPSGTAGLPMLDIIRGNGLKNVLCIVTRYFGGTLLGTGGLVKAYSKSLKDCLENSTVINKVLYEKVIVDIDYQSFGKVENEIMVSKQIIKNVSYTDIISMEIHLLKKESEKIKKKLIEITNGQCKITVREDIYEELDSQGN